MVKRKTLIDSDSGSGSDDGSGSDLDSVGAEMFKNIYSLNIS